MKRLIFFFFAALCLCSIFSCNPRVDREAWVDFVVENQCNDTVKMKLFCLYFSPDTACYSGLERLNPDPTANSNIIFDYTNGFITIPSGACVKYLELYGSSRKKTQIDVEANSQQSIEWIFTDSITIIFSDGSKVLHSLNGTTPNNILKRESYSRTSEYVYTYTITEADHEAAKEAGVR